MQICDKNKCSGCGACFNICPQKAITLEENEYGFKYPIINQECCINCGLCQKTCPSNNEIINSRFTSLVYAAWNKKKNIRKISTSGGVFSLLAEKILDDKGVVVGVAWSKDFSAHHRIITSKKDLYLLYGSKYVQSDTNSIYITVKKELQKGIKVLFSGTPCQIHALNCFLGKPYDNLITVDVVCHGVPPYKLLNRHLKEISGDINQITNVYLRYKNPYWSFSNVKIEIQSKPDYIQYTVDDAYFNLFNFNYSLRNSCHQCMYTTTTRVSDITLSDFWKFRPQNFKMRNFEGGISCIMLNSQKGIDLFEKIQNEIIYEESTIEKAKFANQCLSRPFKAPNDVTDFWTDMLNGVSVSELNKKYIKNAYKVPKMLWIRNIKCKYSWILKRVLK